MYKPCREFKVEKSLHEHLRRETARAHADLETLIEAPCFFASRAGYIAFLQASQAFQAEAERVLDDCGAVDVIPDWPLRQRAKLARADLAALGMNPAASRAPDRQLTHVAKPEWVLGVAYVVEGATLGGSVLLKSVAHLNVDPNRGASFLASYGRERTAMWQSFLTTLACWEIRGIAKDEVVSGASAAFAAAHGYFASVEFN
jgi:heme oxygenase